MIRKILLGIFLIVFYFIFKDMFKAKKRAYEILGEPRKKSRPDRPKEIIEVEIKSDKSGQSHE